MAKVVIFGTGQITELAYFYLENDSEHKVVAFTVDEEYMSKDKFRGLPIIEYSNLLENYPPAEYKLFIPISYRKVNKLRTEKYKDAKKKGYDFITYISSNATSYAASVGENCFILEDNVIQPFVKIGDNCIIWSGNHIGHHTLIEDNCFLASHVVISGSVEIGEYTFIGVNATIRDNVKIGKENVIGASATILNNTDDRAVFSVNETEQAKVPSNRLRGI